MFEQSKYVEDKDNEEKPIGTNNDKCKANKRVHQGVSKNIKEIQEEEGEALPTLEEFAPWYPQEKEAGMPTERSPEKIVSQQLSRQG